MKLLTIGLSPFYFTRNSKIHNSLIKSLPGHIGENLSLSSIFLEHDIEYFPQESISDRYRDINGTFYSTCAVGDSLVTSVFDIIEKEDPDTIITIGSFSDLEYIRAVKRVIPEDFNWIVILTSNIGPQTSCFLDTLRESDLVVCLTNQSHQVLIANGVNSKLSKYGPDDIYFHNSKNKDITEDSCPVFMINDKNVQQSNIAMVLDSFSNFTDRDFNIILHTNYYEQGDYDLDSLTSKFKDSQIEISENFIGLKEGCKDIELIDIYARAHFFIDLSIKPVTSLCSIEAATQGCIPIINSHGSLSESIVGESSIIGLDKFLIDSNIFFGEHLEPFYIASQSSFCNKIEESMDLFVNNEEYLKLSKSTKSISTGFSSKGFCRNISNFIISNNDIRDKKGLRIKVETF